MTLPKRVEHRQPRVRRDVASALRSAAAGLSMPSRRAVAATEPDEDPELRRLRDENFVITPAHRTRRSGSQSPCRRAVSAARARERAVARQGRGGHELAGAHVRPDRRAAPERGSSDQRPTDAPRVTDDGRLLARIYSESDLLVAECLRGGVWRGLNAGRAGGGGVGGGVRVPRGRTDRRRARGGDSDRTAAARAGGHPAAGGHAVAPTSSGTASTPSREPDEGFVTAVYRWATTGDLTAALEASDVPGRELREAGVPPACRRFRALVPPSARPARPDSYRRHRQGATYLRETRDRRDSARRRRS